jgi:hypothetical protein
MHIADSACPVCTLACSGSGNFLLSNFQRRTLGPGFLAKVREFERSYDLAEMTSHRRSYRVAPRTMCVDLNPVSHFHEGDSTRKLPLPCPARRRRLHRPLPCHTSWPRRERPGCGAHLRYQPSAATADFSHPRHRERLEGNRVYQGIRYIAVLAATATSALAFSAVLIALLGMKSMSSFRRETS